MSGSMDELDNRRMSLRWRSESRGRSRKFVYFILEKSCSQQYRCRKTWLQRVEHAQCITLRKMPRGEGDVVEKSCRTSPSVHRCTEPHNLTRNMLSASAVYLWKNEVVFCRLPDNLSMASFLSAEDVDAV